MNDSSPSEMDLLNVLAEEFLARHRRGERPCPSEYAARHPDLAERIRELFPALLVLESYTPPTRETPLPRQLGEYRLIREVGRGGMGVVYEAVQESLKRRVAVKVLSPTLQHGKHRERFEREARAAARLHHTNIVPVFGVGEQDGQPYYVMQFIDGRGLDAVLRDAQTTRRRAARTPMATKGPLTTSFPGEAEAATSASSPATATKAPLPELSVQPEAEHFRGVARWGVQAAEALAHAHAQGVLHRDIKPSNLLLDSQGTLWIADFGLAKADDSDNLTEPGDVVGTLRYLAPERFRGECDARADTYALGVTLYELLTRRPAFDANDRAKLMEQIAHQQPTPPRRLLPSLPRDLETIVLKAMAREAADRYATAEALAEDLRRFLADRPILARRSSPLERLRRWRRRNPALAASTALAVAALVGLVVVSLLFALRTSQVAGELAQGKQATEKALEQARAQRDRADQRTLLAERRLAENYLDRGLNLCANEQDAALGLHWLVRALESTPREATDLERVIRINLTAWSRAVLPLEDVRGPFSTDPGAIFSSPDGMVHLTAAVGAKTAQLWDLHGDPLAPVSLEHSTEFKSAAFRPDGKKVLTVCADGMVQLWSVPSGKPAGSPFHSPGALPRVVFHPDGRTALLVSSDNSPRLWDTVSGKALGPPLGAGASTHQAFSPDGRLVVLSRLQGKRWEAQTWDVATKTPIAAAMTHPESIYGLVFSPDSRTLLIRGGKTVRLWEAASGRTLAFSLEHPEHVTDAAFSPDGKTIVTGCMDRTARLWDAATGRPRSPPLPHSYWLWSVLFSSDGRRVLTTTWDGIGRIWDVATGQPLGPPLRHPQREFPPAQGYRLEDHAARVVGSKSFFQWRIGEPYPAGESRTPRDNFRGFFSTKDRDLIALEDEKTIRVWDVRAGKLAGTPLPRGAFLWATILSADGKTLLQFGESTSGRLWDIASGKPLGQLLSVGGIEKDAAFSPNGAMVAIGGMNKTVRFWDAVTGRPTGPTLRHDGWVNALAFSPDGRFLLTASEDKKVHLWETATGRLVGPPLHPLATRILTFRPDGRAFATASDKTVQLWETATLKPLGPPMKHPFPVSRITFDSEWRTLLTNGARNGACLWDVVRARRLRSLIGHQSLVTAMAVSPDGRILLTGGADKTARLWDAATGKPLGPALPHSGNVFAAAFTRDNCQAVTAAGGPPQFWPLPQPIGGDPKRIKLWVQVLSNMELDDQGLTQILAPDEWRQRRQQLHELGGPP